MQYICSTGSLIVLSLRVGIFNIFILYRHDVCVCIEREREKRERERRERERRKGRGVAGRVMMNRRVW